MPDRSDRGSDSSRKSDARRSVTILVDESLGEKLVPAALRAAGANVLILAEEFGKGTKDTDWLPEAGANGWLVLTADKNIQRNPMEVRAVASAGVRLFVVTATGLGGADLASLCVRAIDRMVALTRATPAPFVAYIQRGGRVNLAVKAKALRRRSS